MKLFFVFFLSCITIGKAFSLMGEDKGNIFAKPNLRGLQAICSDDCWNDNKQSCNACGGWWPVTQPANCRDRSRFELTECGRITEPGPKPRRPTKKKN